MNNKELNFPSNDFLGKTSSELLILKRESEDAISLANNMLINHLEFLKLEIGFIKSSLEHIPAMNQFDNIKENLIQNRDGFSSDRVIDFSSEIEKFIKDAHSDFVKQMGKLSRDAYQVGVIKRKHLDAINFIDNFLREPSLIKNEAQ